LTYSSYSDTAEQSTGTITLKSRCIASCEVPTVAPWNELPQMIPVLMPALH